MVNIDLEVIKLQNTYAIYKNVRDASWQVLIKFEVRELPIDAIKIASIADIVTLKNSEINELDKKESGISYFYEGQWYIIVNLL